MAQLIHVVSKFCVAGLKQPSKILVFRNVVFCALEVQDRRGLRWKSYLSSTLSMLNLNFYNRGQGYNAGIQPI